MSQCIWYEVHDLTIGYECAQYHTLKSAKRFVERVRKIYPAHKIRIYAKVYEDGAVRDGYYLKEE